MNGIEKKEFYEDDFQNWVNNNPERKQKYGQLLETFETAYNALTPLNVATDYMKEAGLSMELVDFAGSFKKLVELSKEETLDPKVLKPEVERLKKRSATFFKDYYQPIDEEVMLALLKLYDRNVDQPFKPEFFHTINDKFEGDYVAFRDNVFKKSMFNKLEMVDKLLSEYKAKSYKKIEKDPAYLMYRDLVNLYEDQIKPSVVYLNNQLDSLQRIYMMAQMEMQPDERFYPDANGTLRITYGNVNGYRPADAKKFNYFSTLEGIMEKEDPAIYDYVVEDKLKELYQTKNYGSYADDDGTLRVCFIATNHTTGGNSGSPVINANGQLVGLNFDRCWEGTMSDLMYDPVVCRNIALDIRYCLFIVDKFAGAGYLLDEMEIVK